MVPTFLLVLISCQSSFNSSQSNRDTIASPHKEFQSVTNKKDYDPNKVPEIRIISNDWGNGNPQDISAVLKSVATELFSLGKENSYSPVWVSRSDNGPIVLYKRGKQGEYLVSLNTKDRFWCQYAFQFSHEVGHILCNFKDGDDSNLWFEESLCETASLYTLLRLEDQWTTHPPYPHWKSYAPAFTEYAQKRINRYKKEIKGSLSTWIKENQKSASKNPTIRARNVGIAIQLLPIFNNDPIGWSACGYLNETKSGKSKSFLAYLNDWYNNCPLPEQKSFVQKIGAEFGFTLPL